MPPPVALRRWHRELLRLLQQRFLGGNKTKTQLRSSVFSRTSLLTLLVLLLHLLVVLLPVLVQETAARWRGHLQWS